MKHSPADGPTFRRATLDAEALTTRAQGDERLPIAISSEAPVLREDWYDGARYHEVLDHSPGAIDMTRAKDGLPLLADHDATQHIGRVEDIRLGADRKLRGMVRFSKSERAQEIARDFAEGIRTDVSVGYAKGEFTDDGQRDGIPVRRYTKWQPMEVSSVAIPADVTVGAGRSAPPAPAIQTRTQRQDMDPVENRSAAETREQIMATGDRYKMPELALRAIGEGWSLEDFHKMAAHELRTRHVSQPLMSTSLPNAGLEMSPREQRGGEFSLRRFIAGLVPDAKVDNGRDREILQEYARTSGNRATRGGYVIPLDLGHLRVDGQRTAMKTTGSAASAVFSDYSGDIDVLRNATTLDALGVSKFPGCVGNVTFVRQTGDPTATWVDEAPASDVADSNPTFDTVTGSPKGLQAMTLLSKLSLIQTTPQMEQKVRASIAEKHALAIDLAAINGSGSSFQPLGILGTSGIGAVALGTNGAAPTYASMVDLESEVAVDNAMGARMGYLTSAIMRGKLRKTEQFATTNGMPVWQGGLEGQVNGYRAIASNQVPQTLTKGTSSDCHAIIYGDWSQLYLFEWGAFELIVDPYTLAGRNIVRVVSYQAVDLKLAHPESFAAIKDARNV